MCQRPLACVLSISSQQAQQGPEQGAPYLESWLALPPERPPSGRLFRVRPPACHSEPLADSLFTPEYVMLPMLDWAQGTSIVQFPAVSLCRGKIWPRGNTVVPAPRHFASRMPYIYVTVDRARDAAVFIVGID